MAPPGEEKRDMRKNTVAGICGMCALAALMMVPVCGAADFTARDGLAKAEKAAAAWHDDAALTAVRTTSLKADGKAAVWQYDYLSPENSVCARVLIIGGGDARLQDMGRCTPAKPVPETFVDSPEMLKAAVSAGFKPDETSNANLIITRDSAAKDKACWVTFTSADFDQEKAAMRGWCVDPGTGKFLVRLSGSN
jgi:hypothetical protein